MIMITILIYVRGFSHMDLARSSKALNGQKEIGGVTVRLWNIEIFREQDLPLEYQLTMHSALILQMGGEAFLQTGEQSLHMRKGSVKICRAGSTFGLTKVGHAGKKKQAHAVIAVLYFAFYEGLPGSGRLREADASALIPCEALCEAGLPESLYSSCSSLYEYFHSGDRMKEWRAQLDFQELLYTMISEAVSGQSEGKRQALERAKDYMHEHYDEDLTLDQLADLAGFSPKYFAEVFKNTYGHTPMDYLSGIRMNKAKLLLLRSEPLLREVAHQVGYKDEFYFSRKFKKSFGLSPSEYRKKRKNKIALYGSTSLLGYAMPLQFVPYAAPVHPKWSPYYYHALGSEIPVHLDAYRQNHNKSANLERLAAASPELIICAQEVELWERELLEKIAPVYVMPGDREGWRAQLLALADKLGRRPEADSWIESYQEKTAACCSALENRENENKTVLTLRVHQRELTAYSHPGMKELLFDRLKLQPALESLLEADRHGLEDLSVTAIKACGADHILLLVRQDSETLAFWKQLQASPEWLMIPAVREGRVHQLPSFPWREYSPVAMERMAEEAGRLFTEHGRIRK